jgi:hypothetical protein
MGLVGLAAIPRPDLPYALMVLMLLVIEAGSELTPDTGSIMARMPARDREWDPVDAAEQRGTAKKAAYAGTPSSLPGHPLDAFTTGCRAALLVLGAMTVVGMVVSARRNPPPAGRGNTSHEAVSTAAD